MFFMFYMHYFSIVQRFERFNIIALYKLNILIFIISATSVTAENETNEKYENVELKSPDYLPMDGPKEDAQEVVSRKETYDVPKAMNIYSEIPERPDIYENFYESLDDVQKMKKRKEVGSEKE